MYGVCGKVVCSFFKGEMSHTKFRLEGPPRVFKEVGNFLLLKLGEKYLDAHFIFLFFKFAHLHCIPFRVCIFDTSKTFLTKACIHMIF